MNQEAAQDPVLEAFEDLARAVEANTERNQVILDRIALLARLRREGLSYREIVEGVERPLIVEMATANLKALFEQGARARRAEAHALHDEGMTMERIAGLFGVSRQRIAELLRDGPGKHPESRAA